MYFITYVDSQQNVLVVLVTIISVSQRILIKYTINCKTAQVKPLDVMANTICIPCCNAEHQVVSPMHINRLLYILLLFFETPQWWWWVQSKHGGDYRYVIKYILPKCIHWFTIYYQIITDLHSIKTQKIVWIKNENYHYTMKTDVKYSFFCAG
jgi:hypothetical protein